MAAAAAVVLGGSIANAAPLVNVEVLGSYNGGAYSSDLSNVPSGSQIAIEVVGVESPNGTNYTSGSTNITINSVGPADGFGSMSYNLTDSANGATISNVALQNSYNTGTGNTPGTVAGGTLTGARPILAAGDTDAFTVFETGTLTVGSLATTESLTPTFGGATSGAKINSGANSLVLNATSYANGEFSLSGLTISGSDVSAVPAPAAVPGCVALLSLGGLVALRRRFRKIA
jgi:MYXO-CTERM domain-containing protein